jgi:hypothetical protein
MRFQCVCDDTLRWLIFFSLDDFTRMKRFALFILLPLAIALTTFAFGILLPMMAELRNLVWESIYGIGFSGTAWFCYFFNFDWATRRPVGLVGVIIWPLLTMAVVFIASRRILRRSLRTRLVWGAAFVVSLFICVVGQKAANYFADRWYLPLFWNFAGNWY